MPKNDTTHSEFSKDVAMLCTKKISEMRSNAFSGDISDMMMSLTGALGFTIAVAGAGDDKAIEDIRVKVVEMLGEIIEAKKPAGLTARIMMASLDKQLNTDVSLN